MSAGWYTPVPREMCLKRPRLYQLGISKSWCHFKPQIASSVPSRPFSSSQIVLFRPYRTPFDLNPPPSLIPKFIMLASNSSQLNTYDAISYPDVQSLFQMFWNRHQFLRHAPNSSQIKCNLSQLRPNASQLVLIHRNSTQCASNRYQMSTNVQ